MRKLTNYGESPFDDDEISIDELLAFVTDHLERFKANDGDGTFSGRIAATDLALENLDDCLVANGTKLGVRRGRKLSKMRFRRELTSKIVRFHAVAVAKCGPKSPAVKEIFPQGRRIFSRCPDDMLKAHILALHKGLQAYEAVLGAGVVAEVETLLNQWEQVYQASEVSTGAKAAAELQVREARRALQLELFLNLLAIAQKYPRQPEKITLFMRQSLLEDPKRKTPKTKIQDPEKLQGPSSNDGSVTLQ